MSLPSAIIAEDFAEFVFPRQEESSWVTLARAERYPGETHRYLWEARWPERQAGVDPQSLVVTATWATSRPPTGPLATIVNSAIVEVLTVCRSCTQFPALTVSPERAFQKPAITAQARGATVVVTVRGRAAISRLFPLRPDSVWLAIYPPEGNAVILAVAVKKPRPAARGWE